MDGPINSYLLFNLALTLLSSFWIGFLFFRARYLFVKPSVFVLSYFNIFAQWPSVLIAHYVEESLPNPYAVSLLIHGYVFVGLFTTSRTWKHSAKDAWQRIHDWNPDPSSSRSIMLLLASLLVLGVGYYLSYVPLSQTGLWVIFTDPVSSVMAREESLKLLENVLPAYIYSLTVSSVIPLLSVFFAMELFRNFGRRRFAVFVVYFGLLAIVGVLASLTGARSSLVTVILVVIFTRLWMKQLSMNVAKIALLLALALIPAVLLSLLREGVEYSEFNSLLGEYFGSLVERTFITPYVVGLWYLYHAQMFGPVGLASIPKLATLLGIPPIDLPNVIGLIYAPLSGATVGETISAPAGYLFTQFCNFGVVSFPFSLLCLWILDVAVPLYARLSDVLLLPTIVCLSVVAIQFLQSDFTVVLVTHGFAIILALSYIISRVLPDRSHCTS
ncbi:MAG: hypothetical protein V1495_06770 [Pseudomonadota bacterium]